MEFTAEQIAAFLGGEVVGDKGATICGIVRIEDEERKEGGLAFLSNPKYEPHLYTTGAAVVIVNRSLEPREDVRATMVRVDDAYGCFAKLLELYEANKPRHRGISPHAYIDPTAKLGDDCTIYPQVFVGMNVRLGDRVTLHPGVKIYDDCVIGNDVTIHAGSVIGADGFGWAPQEDGTYSRIPQIGNVVIEDNVDIGANTCVDRATMGSTVIGRGVKLDNLIQVGHNATIGSNTVIAAQSGIAGSTRIGERCMFAGQVGLAGHITIGNEVKLGSKSGVSNNVPDGETLMGYPAVPIGKFQRTNAIIRNLTTLAADVHELKKQSK